MLIPYLDDFLLLGRSEKEIMRARDSMIFILKQLGFIINYGKSILTPCKRLEFLGVIVDSNTMTLSLPDNKVLNLTQTCQEAESSKSMTAQNLARLVGKLAATTPAVTHSMIQIRYLQRCLRSSLRANPSYQATICLSKNALLELKWWRANLSLLQGKPLTLLPPDMIIQSDAAKSGGWGAHCQGLKTGGQWTKSENKLHINEQEMIAALLAIKTFTRGTSIDSIHLQIDNQAALAYIANQGGTKSLKLLKIAKETWTYLKSKNISITTEWLPTELNKEADYESRNVEDSSEWKLNPTVFRQICKQMGQPTIDLFASRTSHQLGNYMSYKMDPEASAVNAFQQQWEHMLPYAFPPFSLIGKVLKKLNNHSVDMILISPVWTSQPWYPILLEMSIENPILLPQREDLLSNPRGETHPLTRKLQLAAWKVSSNNFKRKEFQKGLSTSSATNAEREHNIITTAPGRSFLAGSLNGIIIHFNVI